MKNAFGATLIFQIVIFFIVVFTGYICLSINQAKAFNVKNEVVKAVERYAPDFLGFSVGELSSFSIEIKEIMENQGYRLEGSCDRLSNIEGDNYHIRFKRDGTPCSDDKCAICIAEIGTNIAAGGTGRYYKVATFYQLDLPVFNSIFNLNTRGETKVIYKKCSVCE